MELNFIKNENSGSWVAEFEATADSNIHIEGVNAKDISILQRTTAGGKYDSVNDLNSDAPFATVFDYDFGALIYPKFIKVVCRTEPTYAEVVSNGEVTEIKAQAKVVEITSNGTTSVEPDAGFSYLSKVDVKVDVPTSGEGGGSDGTGRDIEYFSVANNESAGELIFLMSLVKLDYSGNISIVTSAGYIVDVTDSNRANLIAIGIDMTLPIVMDGVKTTPREWFESNGLSDLSIFGWTPITEEEFYTL